ncbi:hypothetical protein AAJV73_03170 [Cyanobium sp. BSA11S]
MVGAGAPVAALMVSGLVIAPVNPLGTAHGDPHSISGDLLAEPA